MGKESDVVFITVCKQNKYFLEYTARRQKKKKKKQDLKVATTDRLMAGIIQAK